MLALKGYGSENDSSSSDEDIKSGSNEPAENLKQDIPDHLKPLESTYSKGIISVVAAPDVHLNVSCAKNSLLP